MSKAFDGSQHVNAIDVTKATDVVLQADAGNNLNATQVLSAEALHARHNVVADNEVHDSLGNVRINAASTITYDNTFVDLGSMNVQEALEFLGTTPWEFNIQTFTAGREYSRNQKVMYLSSQNAPAQSTTIWVALTDVPIGAWDWNDIEGGSSGRNYWRPLGSGGGANTPAIGAPTTPADNWVNLYSWQPGTAAAAWADGRMLPRVVDTDADRIALRDPQEIVAGTSVLVKSTGDQYMYAGHHLWFRTFHHLNGETFPQCLVYDPGSDQLGLQWQDMRQQLGVVGQKNDLIDPAIIPLNHLILGKIVFVQAEHKFYEFVGNPGNPTNTFADWAAMDALPTPNQPDVYQKLVWNPDPNHGEPRWQNAQMDLVEVRDRDMLDNLPVEFCREGKLGWVASEQKLYWLRTAGQGDANGYVPGLGTLPNLVPHDWLELDMGAGIATVQSDAALPDPQDVDPDNRPAQGDFFMVSLDSHNNPVNRLKFFDGLRYQTLDTKQLVKALESDPAPIHDIATGDLLAVTEQHKKKLSVAVVTPGNSNWIEVFSEESVREWIAAGSQFQGTVENHGHGTAGAIDLSTLVGQSHLSAGDKSHYWIWVGDAAHTITANSIGNEASAIDTGMVNVGDWIIVAEIQAAPGTPPVTSPAFGSYVVSAAATPAIGEVLVNVAGGTVELHVQDHAGTNNLQEILKLHIGDTLRVKETAANNWWDIVLAQDPMVANGIVSLIGSATVHGTAPAAGVALDLRTITPAPAHYEYRVIPGDLLSRALAIEMFSLKEWTQGAWPQDAVVHYRGALWRAAQAIKATDPAPGAGQTIVVPVVIPISKPRYQWHDPAGTQIPKAGEWFAGNAQVGDVIQLLKTFSGGVWTSWQYTPGAGEPFAGVLIDANIHELLYTGNMNLEGTSDQHHFQFSKGWMLYESANFDHAREWTDTLTFHGSPIILPAHDGTNSHEAEEDVIVTGTTSDIDSIYLGANRAGGYVYFTKQLASQNQAFTGRTFNVGDRLVWLGTTTISGTTRDGVEIDKGWAYYPAGSVFPTTAVKDFMPAPVTVSNWHEVEITGKLHAVPADGNLPDGTNPDELWLVMDSTKAGGGPAIYMYQYFTGKWIQVAGSNYVNKTELLTYLLSLYTPATAYPKGAVVAYGGYLFMARRDVLATDTAPDHKAIVTGTSAWQVIPLDTGTKTVLTDSKLPTTHVENGTFYYVINSQKAGNKPSLVMWDAAQSKWIPVSASSDGLKTAQNIALLPTTNNKNGDVYLVLDDGQPYHKSNFYKWSDHDQAWEKICCAIPLSISGGTKVYPDVVQMGGSTPATPYEGHMWHAPKSDAARKMEPVQIYREHNWEFITGWGWNTAKAGELIPGYFAKPSDNGAPADRTYLSVQYYSDYWLAPWVKKGPDGPWRKLRQNVAYGGYLDVELHSWGSWTGDLYSGTVGNAQQMVEIQGGDVVNVIATVQWKSTANSGTWSSGWFALNVGGNEVFKVSVDSYASATPQMTTLHWCGKTNVNGNLPISVTFGGFSHSIQYAGSKLSAHVVGAG